jgi:hypothetical protein
LLSPRAHELDIAAVSSKYRRSVEHVCPEHLPLALRVLERLEPERWTLEWYLPWWLGRAFGLDAVTAIDLVLSNVLGLASIRLQDDLADGEVEPADVAASRVLSAALYRSALEPYRSRFPGASPFWRHLAGTMSTWEGATHLATGPVDGSWTPLGGTATVALAAPGAPLKIPAYAVCLLTDRTEAFPALDRALDHALAGLVLYDHIGDWRADLEAGRWNAFVATVSHLPQDPASRDRNRVGVQLAMLTSDAVAGYVARITSELWAAATAFQTLGLAPAADHLRASASSIEAQGATWQAHYEDLAELAGRLLLDAPTRDRSGDALAASVAPGV